jgi:hypothetical protein
MATRAIPLAATGNVLLHPGELFSVAVGAGANAVSVTVADNGTDILKVAAPANGFAQATFPGGLNFMALSCVITGAAGIVTFEVG